MITSKATGLLVLALTVVPAVNAITLDEADLQAAQAELYPAFIQIHDMLIDDAEAVRALMRRSLNALAQAMDGAPELDLLLVNNPDADAGCLAGGRLFLSLGLLAHIENRDEITAALALAASRCASASQIWRERESAGELPPYDGENLLMRLYDEYRLQALAGLYRQMVDTGCADCFKSAAALAEAAGADDKAPATLLIRIADAWPDSAVVVRFGRPAALQPGHDENVDDGDDGDAPAPADRRLGGALLDIIQLKPTLDFMRRANAHRVAGDLLDAYRANSEAQVTSGYYWLAFVTQMRIELANHHPEYAEREYRKALEYRPDLPWEAHVTGRARVQQNRLDEALGLLMTSLESLPTVSGHYYVGLLQQLWRRFDEALPHLQQVIAAGEQHPYYADALQRIEAIKTQQQAASDAVTP